MLIWIAYKVILVSNHFFCHFMAHQQQLEDFNAFGYNPRGWVANIAGLMFGENWHPNQHDIPCYNGPQVASPQYGPPADYQCPYLPNSFVLHLPHDGYLGALQYQQHSPLGPLWLKGPSRRIITYVASDKSMLLQAMYMTSVDSNFNLTEWWNIAEGEKLSKPFDVGEELVAGFAACSRDGECLISYIGPQIKQGYRGKLVQSFMPGPMNISKKHHNSITKLKSTLRHSNCA